MKFKRAIILFLASGFGSGYTPRIPGTAGSLAALLLYYLLPLGDLIWTLIIGITFITGILLGNIMEVEFGKDPGLVVIDEFAGQWLTLLFLPIDYLMLFAGFMLFRIFDILKPFPADRVQRIPGGLGIMLDDIIAAIYAQAVIRLGLFIFT